MQRLVLTAAGVLLLTLLAACGEKPIARHHAAPGALRPQSSSTAPTAPHSEPSPMTTESTADLKTSANTTPAATANHPNAKEAMFGAGCFWGVEMTFAKTKGVLTTAVGYAGGKTQNPTYRQVCNGDTGHAEVVHLTYDPGLVTYDELLQIFFTNHDPTQVNRQGPDYGTQYRTVIFTYNDEQAKKAEAAKQMLNSSGRLRRPVATLIEPAPTFWRAEEYHQRYLEKQGLESCHIPGS